LPSIEFSQKFSFIEKCPKVINQLRKERCGNEVTVFYHSMNGRRWTNGYCFKCLWKVPSDLHEYVQPGSQLFKIIYGNDPYAETKKNKKQIEHQKELEKEALHRKYTQMFKKTEEKYIIKKIEQGEFLNGL